MSVDWRHFKWWEDVEGRVWIWHDCGGTERVEPLNTETWHIVNGDVVPSVDCRACGKHTFLFAADRTIPPPEWNDPACAKEAKP